MELSSVLSVHVPKCGEAAIEEMHQQQGLATRHAQSLILLLATQVPGKSPGYNYMYNCIRFSKGCLRPRDGGLSIGRSGTGSFSLKSYLVRLNPLGGNDFCHTNATASMFRTQHSSYFVFINFNTFSFKLVLQNNFTHSSL